MATKHYTAAEVSKFHNMVISLALAGLITDKQREQIKSKILIRLFV